jgi:hypothetical protein
MSAGPHAALLDASGSTLARTLAAAAPVTAEALTGFQWRGISLGLPGVVEALTWKTFVKVFVDEGAGATPRGWNLRIRQTGLDGPVEIIKRFGHFGIQGAPSDPRWPKGTALLDYSPEGGPMGRVRDPLGALGADTVLGWTYVSVAGRVLGTPSYFLLQRDRPLGPEELVPRR